MLKPDLNQAHKYLELLDENADKFTFLTFCDDKSKTDAEKSAINQILSGTLDELADSLTTYNNLGAGIFILVNGSDLKGTKKKNMLRVRSYFAEDDGGLVSEFPLEPTFTVQSKKGKHYYFVLKDFTNSIIGFEKTQRVIASRHGTDPAVCNINRVMRLPGFYHLKNPKEPFLVTISDDSGMYYTEEEINKLYPPNEKLTVRSNEVVVGKKGILLDQVEEYLKLPWGSVDDEHRSFLTAVSNIKKNGYSKGECIEKLSAKGELNGNALSQINAVYKNSDYVVAPYYGNTPESKLEQFILESTVYKDASASRRKGVYMINKECGRIENLDESVVRSIKGKLYKESEKICFLDYRPEHDECTFHENGILHLNTFNPPAWKSKAFFNNTLIEPESTMPPVYDKFFNHLFGDFPESKNYVLDWIANSLHQKNITVLALVGTKRGIGKSSLACILGALHGPSNYEVCNQNILGKEFNTQMLNKTLANFDELSIENSSDLEAIKAYTNGVVAIEGKGIDTKTVKIHTSIILTNNSSDCLREVKAADDRQFSIPEITETPLTVDLVQSWGIKDVSELWENEELVDKLARYLYFRDLKNFDNAKNLKSPHYYKIVKNSTLEWHMFLTEDFRSYHYNCAVSLMGVKTAIKNIEGTKSPGRTKIQNICDDYRAIMGTKQIGGKRFLVFADVGETEKAFQNRLEKLSIKDTQGFKILTMPNHMTEEIKK